MKVKAKLTSRITLEIDEKDEMETLHKAIALTSHPRTCSNCQNSEGLYFTSNKDKEGNVYVNIKCPKCKGKAKLGRYRVGGFFWHRDFEVWKPGDKEEEDK
jgi:DnaJ-class molecular chaperone